MTKQELIERYIALDSSTKVRFLAVCSHSLTISLREDYDSSDLELRVKRLQGANELQHHLSSELLRHHDSDEKRYPDEVLINILLEKAATYNLSGAIGWSLNRALEIAAKQPTARTAHTPPPQTTPAKPDPPQP
jgi:hypothetical protein